MGQKFQRYDFVTVKEFEKHFALFGMKFDAIVEGSYYDLYGGEESENDYSLFIMKNGKVVSNASWYDEDQITFMGRDIPLAKKLIEKYKETIEDDEV